MMAPTSVEIKAEGRRPRPIRAAGVIAGAVGDAPGRPGAWHSAG